MSRFDDEGAPLITRAVTARWNLPVAGIQRVLRLQPNALRLHWEEQRRRRAPKPPELEPEDLETETYDEHGERLHVQPVERPTTPHIDLEG